MCSRIAVVCVISALLTTVCSAAHSAPAPAVDCSSLVLNMADCLTFVTVGSTKKKPEGTCCSGLKTVLKTDADCLCEAFSNSAQLGVTLNLTLAMSLPKACHVATPPSVSNCGMRIGTGAAPAEAPVPVSPISVTGSPTAVNGGNEVYPVPALSNKSGVSSLAAPILLLLVAAASFPSFCAFISR